MTCFTTHGPNGRLPSLRIALPHAWTKPEGQAIMDKYVAHVLPCMWQLAEQYYPCECAQMRDLNLGDVYGLCGTGWNKVTLGVNTPTCFHYDEKNILLTATLTCLARTG